MKILKKKSITRSAKTSSISSYRVEKMELLSDVRSRVVLHGVMLPSHLEIELSKQLKTRLLLKISYNHKAH